MTTRLGPDGLGYLSFQWDRGSTVLSAGLQRRLRVPWDCTILDWTLVGGPAGAAVVDIWKDTYANWPPADADSICASALPTIGATNAKATSTSLTGWTVNINAGDFLTANLDSVSTMTFLELYLKVIGR